MLKANMLVNLQGDYMMSIEERIKLNKLEYIDLLKSYFDNVLGSLFRGYYDFKEIAFLIDRLKHYKVELTEETEYLKYLLAYCDKIKEEELLRILELIDDNNRSTYEYYDLMGDKYSEKAYTGRPLRFNEEHCISLLKNHELTDEIKGVALTKSDIDSYFRDNLVYKVINQNGVNRIDCGNDYTFYGAYPTLSSNKIFGVKLVVPPVHNLKTALINIHEYKHGIDLMNMFGKEFPEDFDFEERARNEEQMFIEHYVRNK